MKKTTEVFLQALKCALNGKKMRECTLSAEQWEEVFALSMQHSVLPLVYDAVYPVLNLNVQKKQSIKKQVRQLMMLQMRKTQEFMHLYQTMRQENINVLVVKGYICRMCYPNPDLRLSSDEDLLINELDWQKCHELLTKLNLTCIKDEEDERSYRSAETLYLEVHHRLFPKDSEAYGQWNKYFVDCFENSAVMDCGVVSLNVTDHLIYLILHALKHFMHSGFGIRQVCDVNMFVNHYGNQIDWKHVYDTLIGVHGEVFAESLFQIGKKYLNLDESKLGDCFQPLMVDEMDMLMDLLEGGVYGGADLTRKHSSNITLDAIKQSHSGKKTRINVLSSLFPSYKTMASRFMYVKKHPLLLPVSWLHRIALYSKEMTNSSNNNALKSVQLGQKRVGLMKKYKIIDDKK